MAPLKENKARMAAEARAAEGRSRYEDPRSAVAGRLRMARGRLGLTQKEVAQRINMPLPSYKDYEAGNRLPGGEALGLLILAGINANWLITGEGPMMMTGLAPSDAAPTAPDWKVLAGVIADVENRMAALKLNLVPEKKAELIGLVYDYYSASGKRDASLLDRFLKLVEAPPSGRR